MQGSVQLFVDVTDIDTFNSDDHVDDIYAELTVSPNTQFTTQNNFYGDFGNSRISFSFRVMCSANYFGTDCATYCVPRDDASLGHYTCNSNTGSKICREGWTGVDCLTRELL